MASYLVDLDGTLAHYGSWKGSDHIGDPIPAMLARVRNWLKAGDEVKIFTARASVPDQIPPIKTWLRKHQIFKVIDGMNTDEVIDVVNWKDFSTTEIYDDRAVTVELNTGRILSP